MCELLHTVSANQTCSSVDPSFGAGPLALNAQRPPITWCSRTIHCVRRVLINAQIGRPLSGQTRLRRVGVGLRAHLDSEQFRSVQKTSGLTQGLARPLGSRLSVRQETLRLLGSHSWEEGATSDVKRREFITMVGSAVAWPLAASAQQTPKLPTIGFSSPTKGSVENQRVAAFVQRLRELGWIDGRTVAIKVRWAEGHSERAADIVVEFVRQKVDVIVSQGKRKCSRGKAGHPDCPRGGWRPSQHWPCCESGATGWQCHGPIAPADRSCWQTTRTFARGCPCSSSVSDLGQCRQSCHPAGYA